LIIIATIYILFSKKAAPCILVQGAVGVFSYIGINQYGTDVLFIKYSNS